MTDAQKRIEVLENAALDCLLAFSNGPQSCRADRHALGECALDDLVTYVFETLEAAVGLNNEHLRSATAKQRVKKPEPATP